MRLVTWNCCRGPAEANLARLQRLSPTIAVVQECARPSEPGAQRLWFGENPRQGVAIVASGDYRIEPTVVREVPRYHIPIQVTGPRRFLLLAVWSQQDPVHPYVQGVIRAVEVYKDLIAAQPTVVIGDFNSNSFWNRKRPGARDHGYLVGLLNELGLVSAYHQFRGEAHGAESRPTLYFRWQRQTTYHVDYCFIPKAWVQHVRSVTVGSYPAWATASDHRPIVVHLCFPRAA
jgi:hypothetical protein